HPEETAQLLADAAGIDLAVATTVIAERSNLDVSGIPGEDQLAVLEAISPMLAGSGDVADGAEAVEKARTEIVHDAFATAAVAKPAEQKGARRRPARPSAPLLPARPSAGPPPRRRGVRRRAVP